MKAHLSLEFIGASSADSLRGFENLERRMGVRAHHERHPFELPGPCVLRLHRRDGGIAYERIYGARDYSRANSKGSRGIYLNYVLAENEIYWVKEPRSWRSISHYHCAVRTDGSIYVLSQQEADEWLNAL